MRGRPFAAGHAKRGGRTKGAVNKRTLVLRARILRDEELTVSATIEAIRRGQTYDIRALLDAHGNFRPLQELTEEEAWCIAGLEAIVRRDGQETLHVLKLRFIDRARYVELAARHQGMLRDRVTVDGGLTPVTVTVVHRHVTIEVLEAERAQRQIARNAPENGDRPALGTEVIEAEVSR